MPRIKRGLQEPPRPDYPGLVEELAVELKSEREAGQPRIEEQYFPKTNAIRVTVLWDKWLGLADDDRASTILQAYERMEGKDFRDRIALAIGLTFPEAYESGLLPYQILTMIRRGDAVNSEQCAQAMLDQGASLLFDSKKPELRFATEEEAEACRKRLIQALPGSDQVWAVVKELGTAQS